MLCGKSILSIENVGWALWVLWNESDYEFYSGFDNEIMHTYLVYRFCFSHVQFYSSPFLPARKKASDAELYFCM